MKEKIKRKRGREGERCWLQTLRILSFLHLSFSETLKISKPDFDTTAFDALAVRVVTVVAQALLYLMLLFLQVPTAESELDLASIPKKKKTRKKKENSWIFPLQRDSNNGWIPTSFSFNSTVSTFRLSSPAPMSVYFGPFLMLFLGFHLPNASIGA